MSLSAQVSCHLNCTITIETFDETVQISTKRRHWDNSVIVHLLWSESDQTTVSLADQINCHLHYGITTETFDETVQIGSMRGHWDSSVIAAVCFGVDLTRHQCL